MKYVVLGLGRCGSRIAEVIEEIKGTLPILTVAIDSDVDVERVRAERRLLIGEDKTKGRGCGGDVELASKIINERIRDIDNLISDADVVFTIAGIGKGMGSAIITLNSHILEKFSDKLLMSHVVLPFTSEPRVYTRTAKRILEELKGKTDVPLVSSNDLYVEKKGVTILETAFRELNLYIANTIVKFVNIFEGSGRDHIKPDFPLIFRALKGAGLGVLSYAEGYKIDEMYNQALKNNYCEPEMEKCKCVVLHVEGPGMYLNISEIQSLVSRIERSLDTDVYYSVRENWRRRILDLTFLAVNVKSSYLDRYPGR